MEINEFLDKLKDLENVIVEVPFDTSYNPPFYNLRAEQCEKQLSSGVYKVGSITKGEFGLEHLMIIRLEFI